MLGYLDRFSVDLDFDTINNPEEASLRADLKQIFADTGLTMVKEFESAPFFQVRYPNQPGKRNTLKLSTNNIPVQANLYRVKYFPEIDRLLNSQTLETMFANKLVAVTDRYYTHQTVAGRDIYDIHHFFTQGYRYHAPVIEERTGLKVKAYFLSLIDFIKNRVTQTTINEDLNTLLPYPHFRQLRKILIPETIASLNREVENLPD